MPGVLAGANIVSCQLHLKIKKTAGSTAGYIFGPCFRHKARIKIFAVEPGIFGHCSKAVMF